MVNDYWLSTEADHSIRFNNQHEMVECKLTDYHHGSTIYLFTDVSFHMRSKIRLIGIASVSWCRN